MNNKLTDFLIFPLSCLLYFFQHENVRISLYLHCAQNVVDRLSLSSLKIKAHTQMNTNACPSVLESRNHQGQGHIWELYAPRQDIFATPCQKSYFLKC